MRYWFNKDSEKNNIVILTDKALLLACVDHESMESVNNRLEQEIHPCLIFGGENLQVIPLGSLKSITSCSANPILEISFSTRGNLRSETIGFTDFESKSEFIAFFDELLKHSNNKLIKKEQRQPICFTIVLPLLSLLLGLLGIYLFYNKFRLFVLTVGVAWSAASFYVLLKHLLRPPKVVSWVIEGQPHQNICRLKHAAVAHAVVGLIGVTEIVASYSIPETKGTAMLFSTMQKHEVSDNSIRGFLESGATSTPLISALHLHDEELAVSLLESGADASVEYVGETALDIAIKNNLDKAVGSMLDAKAHSSNHKDLLIRAIQAGGISHENIDRIMVLADDINYMDEQGLTALGNAILHRTEIGVIQCLLEMGASKEIQINGLSLGEYASKQGSIEVAQLLAKY